MGRTVRLRAHHAAARGIPAELPVEQVESIPFFGTSWYVRGVGYWLRRALAVLLLAALLTAFAFEYALFHVGSSFESPVARWTWWTVLAVLLVGSFVLPVQALRKVRRHRRAGLILRPDYVPGVRTRATAGGAGVGYLATTGSALAGAFLFVSVALFFGWFVILLVFGLSPEFGLEHDARLRLRNRHLDETRDRPAAT